MVLTYIRPDADDTDGTWTNESDSGSNLFASIDETVASDADYIKSVHLPDHDICKIRLSDPSGMVMRPATVHYRFKKRGETTQQINLDVSLLQGATEIAKWTETDISTSYVDGSQTLTLAQFNSISDFNNLYIQFDASSSWWLAASEVDLWFEDNLYHLSTALSSASLLLHCDGADASTAFIDATGRHQVTRTNVEVDTAQSKFGGASALGSISGDNRIETDVSSDFSFGTGDFTIDIWVRIAGLTNNTTNALINQIAGTGGEQQIYFDKTDGKIKYYNNGVQITGTTVYTVDGVWRHVALTRASGSTKLFVDGTQQGSTYSDSNNYQTTQFRFFGGGGNSFEGWMDEIRVLKGTAAWTTTFTPPTSPYNVALSGPYAHLSCSRASVGYAKTSSGTLTQFASNALRITDLGLLVEDARTNFALQSQDFTTSWSANAATVTANSIAAPDGTTTAETITEDSASDQHTVQLAVSVPGNAPGTFSCYIKAGTRNFAAIKITDGTLSNVYTVNYNLTSGAITSTNTLGTVTATASSSELLGSGWVRCVLTATFVSSGNSFFTIGISNSASPTYAGNGSVTYTGDGSSNIYLWGAQAEIGSFPSSYIATTTGTQTRAADAVNCISNLKAILANLPFSSVVDVIAYAATTNQRIIGNGSDTADTPISVSSNTLVQMYYSTAIGSVPNATIGNSLTFTGGVKVGAGVSYTARASVGGGGTVETAATGGQTLLSPVIGRDKDPGSALYGYIRRVTTWNSKLADATLQTMTDPAHTINFTTDEAAIDLDFANAAYNAITLPTDFLIISRASVGYAQTLAGTLQLFGANQLRITDKGLLVEDARENKILRSQDINTSPWAPTELTVSGTTTAPDGTATGQKIIPSTNNAIHYDQQQISSLSGTYTFSFYVKNAGYNFGLLTLLDTPFNWFQDVYVNLTTGAIDNVTTGGTVPSFTNTVETLGSGWFRISCTANIGSSITMLFRASVANAAGTNTFTGNGTSGVYVWGAQVEAGSFPSSYIATTGTSQTRAADYISIVSSLNAVVKGAALSTVFSHGVLMGDPGTQVGLLADWQTSSLQVGWDTVANNRAFAYDGNTLTATPGSGNILTTSMKVAYGWTGSTRSLVVNAGTVASDAHGTQAAGGVELGALDGGGGRTFFGYLRRGTFWTSKLADATLQGFTNP